MNILLLGSQGQLGRELSIALAPLGNLFALDRSHLDLADINGLEESLTPYSAGIIVNAAAYTAVDAAEREANQARVINEQAVGGLAEFARRQQALLLHYSTDYVFDGEQALAYRETDPTCPLNSYGTTKLAGEHAIQKSGCNYLILRTSWVYSAWGNNFVRRILQLAKERDQLQVVNDQCGSPTSAPHLAQATAQLIMHVQQPLERQKQQVAQEIYHACGEGKATWYEFACAIVVEAHNQGLLARKPVVTPIATGDYPSAARRPRNSLLNTDKLRRDHGIQLPPWRQGLKEVIGKLAKDAAEA